MSHEIAQNAKLPGSDLSEGHSGEISATRTCKVCKEEKPLSEFRLNRWGRVKKCNDCRDPKTQQELKFPDPTRRPGDLPDQLIRDIRQSRNTRGNDEYNADDKGLSINALVSKYSNEYYESKKYALTWRMVRDILTGRTYAGVE